MPDLLSKVITPNGEGLLRCIQRQGTPDRVYFIELYLDREQQDAVCERFHVLDGLDETDPYFDLKRYLATQRFLGYDHVRFGVDGIALPLNMEVTKDVAALEREGGRSYVNEHRGPITSWEEFERYPWPDPAKYTARSLEWAEKNLPDDMCVIGAAGVQLCEHLSWLMGYETLCYSLFEQRDLVKAIAERLVGIWEPALKMVLQFPRVTICWASDDMGFRSGPLISPDDMREFVLAGHKKLADMSHAAGRPYLLHSCGNLTQIMDDLIDDVKIDAKHSFEDNIELVTDVKDTYGRKIALLGGIDVDFLCRSSEEQIRQRVRETLDKCMPGGGYVLGTGNSVANYIPVESYLVMMDEGRRWSGA